MKLNHILAIVWTVLVAINLLLPREGVSKLSYACIAIPYIVRLALEN